MKFSLCIAPVFTDLPIWDRIKLAKDCGADAVEMWGVAVEDVAKIGAEAAKNSMPIAAITLGQSGIHRLNGPYAAVLADVEKTVSIGKAVGCSTFIGLSGDVQGKTDSQKCIIIDNLKRLTDICHKHGVTIIIEPLNSLYDHKGTYLDSSQNAFEIVRCVNDPHIKVLFDCYHMQIMEGNLTNSILNNIDCIGHFHSAGVPGRHELAPSEINYPFVVQAAEEAGYDQYFGLEYTPTYDNEKSVRDMLAYLRGEGQCAQPQKQ